MCICINTQRTILGEQIYLLTNKTNKQKVHIKNCKISYESLVQLRKTVREECDGFLCDFNTNCIKYTSMVKDQLERTHHAQDLPTTGLISSTLTSHMVTSLKR